MDIKDMADILLKGGKMLGRSCPECNAPLFQQDGRVFCARCKWEEGKTPPGGVRKTDLPATAEGEGKDAKEAQTPKLLSMDKAASEALQKAETVVLRRIHEYAGKLEERSEDANLALNLEVLADLLRLLEGILELKSRAKANA